MSFFEEQVYSLTEGQDERFKGKIDYQETIKRIYEDEELWDNLHSSISDNIVYKEKIKTFEDINDYDLASKLTIKDDDVVITYNLEAILDDGTGVYYSDEDNENLLYTKENIENVIDKTTGDSLSENYVFVDPEWSPNILFKMACEYLDDKLTYLSDNMCHNLDNLVRDIGEDEIRESYEALNKNDEMEL